MNKLFLVSALLLFTVLPIYSHHYVLLPEKFIYQRGENMKVRLMVGEIFNFEFERELQLNMTPRFQLYTTTGISNLLENAKDSALPVVDHRADFDGVGMLVMQRNPSMVKEKPGAFKNYLDEDHVNGMLFDSTKWNKPVVKEKYSRYLKSLVVCGTPGKEDFFMKPVGLKLELIVLKNPYRLRKDEDIPVQVLLDGMPLTNAQVGLTLQNLKSTPVTFYEITDENGFCHFKPPMNAVCVLHCIYMKQLSAGSDADVESYWASYSFKVQNDEE